MKIFKQIKKELTKIPLQEKLFFEGNIVKFFHNGFKNKDKYKRDIKSIIEKFNLKTKEEDFLKFFLRNVKDKDSFLEK